MENFAPAVSETCQLAPETESILRLVLALDPVLGLEVVLAAVVGDDSADAGGGESSGEAGAH